MVISLEALEKLHSASATDAQAFLDALLTYFLLPCDSSLSLPPPRLCQLALVIA